MVRNLSTTAEAQQLAHGYIFNWYAYPGTRGGSVGNRLHRCPCPRQGEMTVPPPKIHADTEQELRDELARRGIPLDPTLPECPICMNDTTS